MLAAARKLSYRPNILAQGLRKGRTRAIGVLWAMSGPHQSESLSRRISTCAQQRGYVTYVGDNLSMEDVTEKALHDFACRHVDGVLVEFSTGLKLSGKLETLLKRFPAAVAVTIKPETTELDQVVRDRTAAYVQTARHFATRGRRRPAIVVQRDSGQSKIAAFTAELSDHQIELPSQRIIDLTGRARSNTFGKCCFQILQGLFPDGQVPFDALMCQCDEYATAAIAWIRSKGLRVPEDVAVVGFNNNDTSEFSTPPLASVNRRDQEVAQAIERMLFARLERPALEPQLVEVPMEFVWRESAG